MDGPHAEVEIKLQLKSRGSVAKEEDPKRSQQLYKVQTKSTWSTGKLCVYGIYKRSLRAPTKENTLILIAVVLEARTRSSRTRLESELPPQQVQRSAQHWRAS